MGGSIVSGKSQCVTFRVRSSENLELLTLNPRVSLVPPVSLGLLGSGDQPVDGSDGSVFLVTLSQQLREGEVGELGELVAEGFGDSLDDGMGVSMGAAERFRNHFIDNMEVDQVLRRHLQGGGGIGNFRWIIPQDGSAAFRRNHRIDTMLQHEDAI